MTRIVAVRMEPARRGAERNALDRLALRFPALIGWLNRRALQLPRGTRLRKAALRRAILTGYQATNRRDWDATLSQYARDSVFELLTGFELLGIDGASHGHEGFRSTFDAVTEDIAIRLTPDLLIDLGERLVVLGSVGIRTHATGAELDSELGQLIVLERGLVKHQRTWRSWDDALAAAGLDRAGFELPERRRGVALP